MSHNEDLLVVQYCFMTKQQDLSISSRFSSTCHIAAIKYLDKSPKILSTRGLINIIAFIRF